MKTEPPSDFKIWSINAAAILVAVALLPKEGKSGGVALALSLFDVVVMAWLMLLWSLPRIRRMFPSRVIQICLGVATITLAVGGSLLLAGAVYVGTGGRH